MQKPDALIELIQELLEEGGASDVDADKGSSAVVYTSAKALNAADGIALSAKECVLLLANRKTVERMVEALDNQTASIVLTNLGLPDSSLEALERSFTAVDEE